MIRDELFNNPWAKLGTFDPVTNMYSESTISLILTPCSNFNKSASFWDYKDYLTLGYNGEMPWYFIKRKI